MADADRGAEYLDQHAVPVVVDPVDLVEQLRSLWDAGLPPGFKTGWPSLDQHYTVVPGQLTVLTGWPSSGKSEFLDAMLVNLARQGWATAMFSPENQPTSIHAQKFMEKILGKPFGAGPSERISREEIGPTAERMARAFRFMDCPEEGSLSPKSIMQAAWPWLSTKKLRGLVMDPWNELEHWRPANLNETEYVSQQLSLIRRWALTHAVHVWIVAHPQKMRTANDKLPIPRPDMISGSQHWWNKADCALTVWRDMENQTPEVQIHVQKVRFKHVGRQGLVTLNWDRVTGRYHEQPTLHAVAAYRSATSGDGGL